MSILISTDVVCDECGDWETGIEGQRGDAPDPEGARRAVSRMGWTRVQRLDEVLDLCPSCGGGNP